MVLGKEGCIGTMSNIFSAVPKTHYAKIKFIIEIFSHLTKASKC